MWYYVTKCCRIITVRLEQFNVRPESVVLYCYTFIKFNNEECFTYTCTCYIFFIMTFRIISKAVCCVLKFDWILVCIKKEFVFICFKFFDVILCYRKLECRSTLTIYNIDYFNQVIFLNGFFSNIVWNIFCCKQTELYSTVCRNKSAVNLFTFLINFKLYFLSYIVTLYFYRVDSYLFPMICQFKVVFCVIKDKSVWSPDFF